MINSRLSLHNKLVNILGSNNVYFQPPESKKIQYPCITYSLINIPEKYADNENYVSHYCYQVTLIDQDPDNDTVDKLKKLRYSKFVRHFSTQGLNHYVFNITYKYEKENN